jgi:hypothetical protein
LQQFGQKEALVKVGRNVAAVVTAGLVAVSATLAASAAPVTVLNHSFESPTVTLAQVASPFVDNWVTDGPSKQEFPPGSGFFVNVGTGIFPNTPAVNPDHIDNVDGNQAAFIATQTGNEFTQVLGQNFAAGQAYTLTTAVAHSFGSPPAATDEVRLALYYVGADNQRHIVLQRDVFNDVATGLSANHFNDFSGTSPVLAAGDPAVGQPIGVLLTTIGDVGGFFDLDNVRVDAVPEPAVLSVIGLGAMGLLARRGRRA